MRLTVHVEGAKKEKVEVRSKEKPGTFVMKEVLKNTYTFTDIKHSDVERLLKEAEADSQGFAVKHYLSGEKIAGRATVRKKK